MRLALKLNLTFESICPTVKVSRDFLHRPPLPNKLISYKYGNQRRWINESTSKCSGVSGSFSLNSPFHGAGHILTPWGDQDDTEQKGHMTSY